MIHRQISVAAAGTNHNGGAGPAPRSHDVRREGWLDDFLVAFRAGGSAGPQEIGFGHARRGLSGEESRAHSKNAGDATHGLLRYHLELSAARYLREMRGEVNEGLPLRGRMIYNERQEKG